MSTITTSAHDALTQAASMPGSVLLQSSRCDAENRKNYLFTEPVQVLTCQSAGELPRLFAEVEAALAGGLYVAGFLSYEAGYGLLNIEYPGTSAPLAWFGLYSAPISFEAPATALLQTPAFTAEEVDLTLAPESYREKVREIKEYIAAGATYQVNLTDRIHLRLNLSAEELFAALCQQQPVAYSAFVNLGERQMVSLSPELFFRVVQEEDGRRIVTRPMKGTWPRGLDAAEDALNALHLQNDEKNRSEHLMIVDLLRNDLGRICTTGSVHVDDLFAIERYETLLQMTSTISGTLPEHLPWIELFRSLFPSGSITGAPKISTMNIIRSLEDTPRGIYTGAIGFIAPTGDAVFNVAIRTLDITGNHATMGVGGGIVIDSEPEAEYAEARLKASFLFRAQPAFELFETLLWNGSYFLLDLHLERLQLSCEHFGFAFDEAAIRVQMQQWAANFTPLTLHRVRLTLDRRGSATLSSNLIGANGTTCRVTCSKVRTSSSDIFLRHKTTHRALYDTAFAQAQAEGFDDILFLNERDEITEGAISNLFVRLGGRLYTPPLSSGVLAGTYRRHLLDTLSSAEERVLTLADLGECGEIFLCNSVRGLRRVIELDSAAWNSPGSIPQQVVRPKFDTP